MRPEERTRWVVAEARALGFDLAGVATAEDYARAAARLPEWLARGYAGQMRYLHDRRRLDVRRTLPGARSIIVCAMNYQTDRPLSTETPPESGVLPRGWISRYAWGDDYHTVLGPRLEKLVAAMRAHIAESAEPFEARWYVDTGPVAERLAARAAGLGWLGKNTCLINEQLGSWLFLGVVLTTLELAPTVPAEGPPPDLCGQCRLCLDACPTAAITEPYLLDPRRCVSYLTIELRGEIPEELSEGIGRMVFGCDICQDVCPWNGRAPASPLAEFQPRSTPADAAMSEPRNSKRGIRQTGEVGGETPPGSATSHSPLAAGHSLFSPSLEWLLALTEEEFRGVFSRSAVRRTKWRGLVRNACLAVGNAAQTLKASRRLDGRGTGARSPAAPSAADTPAPPVVEPGEDAYARLLARLALLAASPDPVISSAARRALDRFGR